MVTRKRKITRDIRRRQSLKCEDPENGPADKDSIIEPEIGVNQERKESTEVSELSGNHIFPKEEIEQHYSPGSDYAKKQKGMKKNSQRVTRNANQSSEKKELEPVNPRKRRRVGNRRESKSDSKEIQHTGKRKKSKGKGLKEVPPTSSSSSLTKSSRKKGTQRGFRFFGGDAHHRPALHPGSKSIPIGAPNCLEGITFVITGILDGLEREVAENLIHQYGGYVRTSVSGRTDYLIVGSEPGNTKINKAKEKKTQIIGEDDLLEMIRSSNPEQRQNFPEEQQEGKESEVRRCGLSAGLWVDKYRPKKLLDIIGNKSKTQLLVEWLTNWKSNFIGFRNKLQPSIKTSSKTVEQLRYDIPMKKAALISGVSGIGKTTAAHIVCNHCGFFAMEMNASDFRSRSVLKEKFSEILHNHTISEYDPTPEKSKNICLIMDEVDGMSGGDKGGILELVKMITTSHIPIICICNDRQSQKIKTLASLCLDLRFQKPPVNEITKLLCVICDKEGISYERNAISHIAEVYHNDVRAAITNLQFLSLDSRGGKITYLQTSNQKHVIPSSQYHSIFDIASRILSIRTKDIKEKLDGYFFDSQLIPLFIQENYINSQLNEPSSLGMKLQKISKASDSLSVGDVVNTVMRKEQIWNLSNLHALYSTVLPSEIVQAGYHGGIPIEFPSMLQNIVMTNKNIKTIQNVRHQMWPHSFSSNTETATDYVPFMKRKTLIEYGLEKEDIEDLKRMKLLENKIR